MRHQMNKGRSPIYMNLLAWLTPCLIPLGFFSFLCYLEFTDKYNLVDTGEFIENMFWLNLAVMIPAAFGLSWLIRKWKSLAEE
jgi:hypothetical protein